MTESTETHHVRVVMPDGTVPVAFDLTTAPGAGVWLAAQLAVFQAHIRDAGGSPPAFTLERPLAGDGSE